METVHQSKPKNIMKEAFRVAGCKPAKRATYCKRAVPSAARGAARIRGHQRCQCLADTQAVLLTLFQLTGCMDAGRHLLRTRVVVPQSIDSHHPKSQICLEALSRFRLCLSYNRVSVLFITRSAVGLGAGTLPMCRGATVIGYDMRSLGPVSDPRPQRNSGPYLPGHYDPKPFYFINPDTKMFFPRVTNLPHGHCAARFWKRASMGADRCSEPRACACAHTPC